MSDGRAGLAAAQTRLLHGLVGGAAPPAGFDAARLQATTETLVAKRADGVRRVLPVLVETLGPAYPTDFADFARGRPRSTGSSTSADALAFAEWAAARRSLPELAQIEVARTGLRLSGRQIAVRRQPGRLLVVTRRRVVRLPLPR